MWCCQSFTPYRPASTSNSARPNRGSPSHLGLRDRPVSYRLVTDLSTGTRASLVGYRRQLDRQAAARPLTAPERPLERLAGLRPDDVVDRLAPRDQGRAAVVPEHLRDAPDRDVVRAHRGAVGAGVVQHQQVAMVGTAERPRDQQLLVVAREHVAALAERPGDDERLRLALGTLAHDRDVV